MLVPATLPEFEFPAISWAMRRNPMRVNFGVDFAPRKPVQVNAASWGNSRYRLTLTGNHMYYKYCGHSFKPKSNEAIWAVARYILSLSLPFAACSNATCPNFGINVFEKLCARATLTRSSTADCTRKQSLPQLQVHRNRWREPGFEAQCHGQEHRSNHPHKCAIGRKETQSRSLRQDELCSLLQSLASNRHASSEL